jgi:anti-sigma factor RsiW
MSQLAYVCKQFVEDVTAYLEGTLPGDVVARIDEHLVDCPHCREYLREMRRTIADAGALSERDVDVMPADLRNRLLDAFGDGDV